MDEKWEVVDRIRNELSKSEIDDFLKCQVWKLLIAALDEREEIIRVTLDTVSPVDGAEVILRAQGCLAMLREFRGIPEALKADLEDQNSEESEDE